MNRARDLMRIRVNVTWLLIGFLGEACAIMYGRRDMRRGDSIFNEQTGRIRKLREEARLEREQEKAASAS